MSYVTHELQQGSNGWHKFRSEHYGASECAAMLGLSKYTTRTELLRQKATGISKEVDANTQAIFDRGHATEALARPIVEEQIGEQLSPVTLSKGKLSCSCDGLTFDDSIAWEHKQKSTALFAAVAQRKLPEEHQPQCQQILMITGAEKLIFTVSSGTEQDMMSMDVLPDPVWFERIISGWQQFEKDLADYQHVEIIEKPKAEMCIELPALFVHAKGEITTHNMQEFGEALQAKLVEVRAIALVTDQDFSNAKAAAKMFRDKAKEIRLAKEAMLSQTVTIGEAARMMDAWDKDLNSTALQLEKDVEREDLAKKRVMVGEAGIAFSAHVEALEAETRPIQLNVPRPNFAEAIKGKRNYTSMQDALDTALAQGKIEADAVAKDLRAKLAWCKENAAGMSFLFPDLEKIIIKQFDDFTLLISSRIKEHKESETRKAAEIIAKIDAENAAKLEAERSRIQAEEEAKAKAAQDALLAAERVKMEAEVRAKAEEEARQAQSEAAAIEERRKQAQIADQIKPVRLSGLKTAVAQSITPRRPNRAELLDAIATTFGTTNEAALDWILQEFRGDIQHEERKAA